ncbi:MAG: hypothetical protein J6C62_01250 [Clostridia bacterium]|nr:hypothetical protein [Clostridia bacterium]
MKKYVYMVEFDWSVEDGCDIETELFATYDKALERYNQLVNEEKNNEDGWVHDVFEPNGTILKGYTFEEYGNKEKQEDLYWSCVMDEWYEYHSIIQLKKLEVK